MEGRSCSCFKRVWIVCYKIEKGTITTEENKELLRDFDIVIKDQVKSEIIEAIAEHNYDQLKLQCISYLIMA